MDFKNCKPITLDKDIKCNCTEIDENLCDELLENIERELKADRPKDFKIHNIKRMIEDFYH